MANATKQGAVKQGRKVYTAEEYAKIRAELQKPRSERKPIVIGRDGEGRLPRNYGLKPKVAETMRKEIRTTGKFVNPYRQTGIYGAFVQALVNLGADKKHSFKAVKDEVKSILSAVETEGEKGAKSNAWKDFVNRPARNPETGKDADGRFMQTACVLQRITGANRYGEKLQMLGACIDILKGTDDLPMYMLHTGFANVNAVKPTNEMLRRGRKAKGEKKSEKKADKKTAAPKKAAAPKTAKPKTEKKVKAKAVARPKKTDTPKADEPVADAPVAHEPTPSPDHVPAEGEKVGDPT